MDLALPDQSGLGLCRTVRESPELAGIPIIVLTGQAGEMDRVLAFESGVDDFLAKPFYAPELGARVSAVLRGFASRRGAPRSERAVDAHVKSIRRKPGRARRYIETVRGVGYRLSDEARRSAH